MKVDKANINPSTASSIRGRDMKADVNAEVKGGKSSNVSEAKNLAGSAQVNVSTEAQRLQKAKEIASDTSVNEARIAQLQKLIDEGNYKVDASGVADRLVDEHLLMSE